MLACFLKASKERDFERTGAIGLRHVCMTSHHLGQILLVRRKLQVLSTLTGGGTHKGVNTRRQGRWGSHPKNLSITTAVINNDDNLKK